jgi:hypothetical protein
MNRDLGQLLKQAMPEPPHYFDAGEVLNAARHRRRLRLSLAALAAVALAGVAIGTPLLITHPGDKPRPGGKVSVPLHLSVLERRVPLGTTAAGILAGTALVHPGEGSLVATLGSPGDLVALARHEQVYLVEAANDQLCLVDVIERYGSGLDNCQPRSDLLTAGVMLPVWPIDAVDTSGPWTLIVAVPDGYLTATAGGTTVKVANNVAVLQGKSQTHLTISGPRVPSVTFSLRDVLGAGR